jgi:hypothetical protein
MQTEKFFCEDFAPIPQDPEAEIYLEATAKDDLSTIFFAGNLKINDLYNVTDPSGNRGLPVDMNLTVYDSQGGTLLQRVQYHSSCSQNLFLRDRYGASQLVSFFNELQGLVDCSITSNYTFTIANNGALPATLESCRSHYAIWTVRLDRRGTFSDASAWRELCRVPSRCD